MLLFSHLLLLLGEFLLFLELDLVLLHGLGWVLLVVLLLVLTEVGREHALSHTGWEPHLIAWVTYTWMKI